MIRLFLITFFLGMAQMAAFAQYEDGDNEALRERIRAQRAAIYTEVLQLTAAEAQGFWPVFNQYLNDREQINKQYKPAKNGNLSDAEAEENIRKHFEKQQKDLDLERDLVQKLRKVITVQQIARIPEAERIFRKTILEKAKDRAKQQRQNVPAGQMKRRGGKK